MVNTQTEMKPRRGRPRNPQAPKSLLLRLPHELHQKMKEQAAAETLELTAWIRRTCVMELRRKKKAA